MASTVTWELSLNEVEIGKEVTLTAEGLDKFEGMVVLIQKPDGSHFMWGVTSDGNGRVRETIKLDSGLGQYLFCPRPACGYVVPRCRHLNVCPCGTAKTNCNIQVVGPNKILTGQKATWEVSHLQPSKVVSVKIANNRQVSSLTAGIAGVDGIYHFETSMSLADTYSLVFGDGHCTSAPFIFDVISSTNEDPALQYLQRGACDKTVDIKAAFNKGTYAHSEAGNLKVTICNRSPYSRTVALTKSIQVPGATVTSNNIPDTVTLAGLECKEFLVLFLTGTADASYSASITGNYDCNNALYAATGGSAHAILGAGIGVCNAILQYFGTDSGGTSYAPNDEVEIKVDVYNSGNAPISEIKLATFPLPANVTFVSGVPQTVTTLAPGATKSLTFKVKPSVAGTYTIHLPSDKVTYKCGSEEKPIGSPGFITLTVV